MSEPFFVEQMAGWQCEQSNREWLKRTIRAAVEQGAGWIRVARHPEFAELALLEAWTERPVDEGEPRFKLPEGKPS